jgi:PAS domain S-box-containing protein
MTQTSDAPGNPLDDFALPDNLEGLDAATLKRARAFLTALGQGVFPDGLADSGLLTWADRLFEPQKGAHPLSIEERLKAAEARFLTLVEQIPAVTFMAVLGEGENDVYVSPHIEQMLGYSQEEWLSDPFLWYYRLHPDDRPRWNQEFARGVRTGGPFRSECRFLARDGHEVWVHGEARLVKDELGRPQFLQGVAFDISESKRAQEILLQAAVQDARAAEEIAIAHRVQTSILPRDPALPGLEIAAIMVPADDVGGDYYDVRPNDHGGWIMIGDVSGHGLDAGLVMLMVHSAACTLTVAHAPIRPPELLALLNQVIYDAIVHRLERNEYVTLSVLRYSQSGLVEFAGAHQDILVLRARTRRVERISTPGPWVGIRSQIGDIVEDGEFMLEPGDVLVLYTDGVTEATDAEGELFDVQRLCAAIEEVADRSAAEIRDYLLVKVETWSAQTTDDITLFVARYSPPA